MLSHHGRRSASPRHRAGEGAAAGLGVDLDSFALFFGLFVVDKAFAAALAIFRSTVGALTAAGLMVRGAIASSSTKV
jgi:hypothetical protein